MLFYRKYFLEFNGAKLDLNVFIIDDKNESGVNALIPVSEVIDEKNI